MAEIYGLYDRDGSLRYIGKANNSEKRLKSHLRDSRRRDTPVYRWIRKRGVPVMRVLHECKGEDWKPIEKRLIAEARARGEKLLNVADGGDQPFCSDKTRRQNAVRLNQRIVCDPEFAFVREVKRRMSQAMRQGYVSNKSRAMLREAANLCPEKFGCFADIPDREEDENGRGIVIVGGHRVTT